MRRKVKKSLTFLMALVMIVSLICSRELSAFAEDVGAAEQTSFETETLSDRETFPEETSNTVFETEGIGALETETFEETFLHIPEETFVDFTEVNSEEETGEEQTEDVLKPEILEFVPEIQPSGISVKALAARGVLPDDAVMTVKSLEEGSEQYQNAEEALTASDVEFDGFKALDISFMDADGNETEPEEGTVQVKFEFETSFIPEEANVDTLAVQHLDESSGEVEVQTVADAAEGTVALEDAVVTADFEVESFSTFTLTWNNNNNNGLSIICIDENGTEIGNNTRRNVSSATAVSSLAPAIDGYVFKKAVVANSAQNAIASSANIEYLQYQNRSWQYSLSVNGNYSSVGYNTVYFIYSNNESSGGSTEKITFSYTNYYDIGVNTPSISTQPGKDQSYMRYTIVLHDPDTGTDTYLDTEQIAGAVYPAEFTFNNTHISISAATINQMGIQIPGYTFENGYAFFYWSDHFAGNKTVVSDIINYGKTADGGYSVFDSYLGYQCSIYGGDGSIYCPSQDYTNAKDYLAYNPTGVLRLVFTKVSTANPYHVNYVDAFASVSNPKFITQESMSMGEGTSQWDGEKNQYYGIVPALTDEVPTHDGYEFAGWYKAIDADGNGTGDLAQTDVDAPTHFYSDVTYYAKWVPSTRMLTVKKLVDGDMGDKNQYFTFSLKLTKDGQSYTADVTDNAGRTLKASNGVYTFDLKDKEEIILTLPRGCAYEITEDSQGYAVKVDNVAAEKAEGTLDENRTVTFTNTKNVVPPTGLSNNVFPYILMVIVAIGAIGAIGAIFCFVVPYWKKRIR